MARIASQEAQVILIEPDVFILNAAVNYWKPIIGNVITVQIV